MKPAGEPTFLKSGQRQQAQIFAIKGTSRSQV
jgi:hypothetical protein